jgi:hypothetical protein
MGFLRNPVAKLTLADANEARDWRMWHDLASLLIRRARRLHAQDSIGLDLDNTVDALDSTTIGLCLSLFPWADFRAFAFLLSICARELAPCFCAARKNTE